MTDLLNLDEIHERPTKTIILGGKKYAYHPPTVKTFVERNKRLQELEKKHGQDIPIEVLIDVTLEMIVASFPGCPRDKIEELDMDTLDKLRRFIEADVQPTEEAKAAEGNG